MLRYEYNRQSLVVINKGLRDENKNIFDKILDKKSDIESKFEHELDWQRLDGGKGSIVAYYFRDVNIFNGENWDKMIDFMTKNMINFKKSIKMF